MKPHTYICRVKNLDDGTVINVTVEATGKTEAQNSMLTNPCWKAPWSVIMSSFKRLDTAKGAQRAGGLDSNGKQRNARTMRLTS